MAKRINYTVGEIYAICEDYLNGKDVLTLALEREVDPRTIIKVLVEQEAMPVNISPQKEVEIVSEWLSLKSTVHDICAKYKIPAYVLDALLKRNLAPERYIEMKEHRKHVRRY